MLAPAFDFNLNHPCLNGLCTIAKCKSHNVTLYFVVDGVHPSLAMATSGGKILLHQPYKSKTKVEGLPLKDQDLTFINTSKQICALTAGQLDPKR